MGAWGYISGVISSRKKTRTGVGMWAGGIQCGHSHSQSLSTFETRCEVGVIHFMSSGPPRPPRPSRRLREGGRGTASVACLSEAVKREGAPGSGFRGVRSSSSSPQRESGARPPEGGLGWGNLSEPSCSCCRS